MSGHADRPGARVPDDVPVVVDLDGSADDAWRQCADVLYGVRPRPAADAVRVARLALLGHPGCLLSVLRCSGGGCVVGLRRGDGVAVTALPLPEPLSTGAFVRFLCLLHGCVVRSRTQSAGSEAAARPLH